MSYQIKINLVLSQLIILFNASIETKIELDLQFLNVLYNNEV